MSSAADPASFASIGPQPVRMLDGQRMLMRALFAIVGVAMLLTAGGLWLAPGASWAPDMLAMKLAVTLGFAGIGLALLQSSAKPAPPKVEIDTIQHEVRLVRTRGRDRYILDRCKFKDLTLVENSGTHVQLWGKNNTLIAEVAASDRLSHRSLVTALRVAGKL